MSDYTHDDAMRDLESIDHSSVKSCRWCSEKRDRLAAYIERLEAENERLMWERVEWIQNIDKRADKYAAMLRECESERERLEAENAVHIEACGLPCDIAAERDEWEAVARWLAQRLAGFRYQTRDDLVPTEDKAIANWLAAAQEAVRYE